MTSWLMHTIAVTLPFSLALQNETGVGLDHLRILLLSLTSLFVVYFRGQIVLRHFLNLISLIHLSANLTLIWYIINWQSPLECCQLSLIEETSGDKTRILVNRL